MDATVRLATSHARIQFRSFGRWVGRGPPRDNEHAARKDDFDSRFDEDDGDATVSFLGDVTNTQLRKMRPGSGRARALFDPVDLSSPIERKEPVDWAARFRVSNLQPDDSLMFEDGEIETLIKDGRKAREQESQRQKARLERDKTLRAQHRGGIREEVQDHADERFAKDAKNGVSERRSQASFEADDHRTSEAQPSSEAKLNHDYIADEAKPELLGVDEGAMETIAPQHMLQRMMESSLPNEQIIASGFQKADDSSARHSPRSDRPVFLESVGSVLARAAGQEKELSSTQIVSALSAVARSSKSSTYRTAHIGEDPRIASLLRRIGTKLNSLSPRELCDVLSAVTRLHVTPQWIDQLLSRAIKIAPAFDHHCIVTTFLAVGRLQGQPSDEAKSLVLTLQRILLTRPEAELKSLDSLGVVSLCVAFARLGVSDAKLFDPLREATISSLLTGIDMKFTLADASTCIAAIAVAGHASSELMDAAQKCFSNSPPDSVESFCTLCKAFEHVAPVFKDCIASHVVQPWLHAFSEKTGSDDHGQFLRAFTAADRAGLCIDFTLDIAMASSIVPSISGNTRQQASEQMLQPLSRTSAGARFE